MHPRSQRLVPYSYPCKEMIKVVFEIIEEVKQRVKSYKEIERQDVVRKLKKSECDTTTHY